MEATSDPQTNATSEVSEESSALAPHVTIWSTVVVVLNLVLNPLMLVTLRRVASIQPTTKIFMASLTLSDLCTGLVWVFKLPELFAGAWLLGEFLCAVSGVLVHTFHVLGILSLVLLTVDRYIAISRPLRYPRLVTAFRSKVTVSITWATSVVLCILLYGIWGQKIVLQLDSSYMCVWETYNNWRVYGFVFFLVLALGVIFALYMHVSIIARHHARRIMTENQAGSGQEGLRVPRYINTKATTTIIIITGTLVFTWVPTAFTYWYLTSAKQDFQIYNYLAFNLTDILMMSNSWLNVIIYYLRNRDLRQALRHLLSTWQKHLFKRLHWS